MKFSPLAPMLALAFLAPLFASAAPAVQDSHQPGLENPVANPKAMVQFEHARFTVLTPELLRLEWSADGRFEDHASFVFLNRNLPVPEFHHKIDGNRLTIQTSALTLTYTADSIGKFTPENLSITFEMNGQPVTWHPGLPDTGNLEGTTRTLDGAIGSHVREPIGPGLISRAGWVVVDDSTRPLFDSADFRFAHGEQSPWPWAMERPAGDRQDWYFFGYGHHYKEALGDFVRVAGRIPLPPRFAFGAWWSRYWDYSDQELDDLIHGFRENSTPLDVLVIDMGWHISRQQLDAMHEHDQSGESLGWSGYTWNKMLFPDPEAFLHKIHQEGLKATLNLHPASGVQPWEQRYPEMARAMGIDPATRKYVPFDITSKKFATNYMDILHHPLEKQGIDFWWLDWQQDPHTKMPGVNPTWWLNYVHFTDQEREGKRPLLFHRWGGLGNHRYQIGFSGDSFSVWPSLAFQPWFTATAANVGYAYWSHDIGGHQPGVVDPEIFTRWVQFGAFSPILRTHTTKNPDAERRIWAYPEPYSGILRDAFQERYAMIPYIYTEARRTYDTGVAFLRPLYYDWPEEDAAYTSKNEYRFGSQMLLAPVTAPADPTSQLATEAIWLPKGEWIEVPTGRRFTGPIQLERKFSIRQIPVYVPAGAIVPTAPPMLWSNQKPLDPLILTVYPMTKDSHSAYTLYEDAGDTRAYQQNQAAWTTIAARDQAGVLTVMVEPAKGSYPGMLRSRSLELRLPGDWPPASVTVNGRVLGYSAQAGTPGWRYAGNTLTTILTVPAHTTSERVTITVHRSPVLVARRAQLDGFPGQMTRLREAYDILNQTFPLGWAPDPLVDAMQTGDRLTYRPETAAAELDRFHAVLPQAIATVNAMHQKSVTQNQEKLTGHLSQTWQSTKFEIASRYLQNTTIAMHLIEDVQAQNPALTQPPALTPPPPTPPPAHPASTRPERGSGR